MRTGHPNPSVVKAFLLRRLAAIEDRVRLCAIEAPPPLCSKRASFEDG